MMPDSPATPVPPSQEAAPPSLAQQQITVLAAWHKGLIGLRDLPTFSPKYFPNPYARGLWFTLRSMEAVPDGDDRLATLARARREYPLTDSGWEALWAQVVAASETVTREQMQAAVDTLMAHWQAQERAAVERDLEAMGFGKDEVERQKEEPAEQPNDDHGHAQTPPEAGQSEGAKQADASQQREAGEAANNGETEQPTDDDKQAQGVTPQDVTDALYGGKEPQPDMQRGEPPHVDINPYATPILYPEQMQMLALLQGWYFFPRSTSEVSFLQPEHFPIQRYAWVWRAMQHLEQLEAREIADLIVWLEHNAPLPDADWKNFIPGLFGPNAGNGFDFELQAVAIYNAWVRRTKVLALRDEMFDLLDPAYVMPDEIPLPGTPERFEVEELDELGEEDEPIEWAIEGLLERGSVAMIYGESGAKKSWAALTMTVAKSLGLDWCGFHCTAGPVLVVDEDAGKRPLEKRLRMVRRGYGDKSRGPHKYMSMQSLDLSSEKDQQEFERLIARLGPVMAVVDTFAAVAPGDENLRKDMQPILTFLRYIASKYHCAILLIHHANRMGEYRGSSAIKASLDLLVEVSSKQGSDRVNFKTEKVRDGAPMKWSARAVWEGNAFRLEKAEWKEDTSEAALSPLRQWILDYLRAHGESSKPDLVKAAGKLYSEIGIRQALKALEEEGLIRRTNTKAGGKASNTVFYELSPSEEEE